MRGCKHHTLLVSSLSVHTSYNTSLLPKVRFIFVFLVLTICVSLVPLYILYSQFFVLHSFSHLFTSPWRLRTQMAIINIYHLNRYINLLYLDRTVFIVIFVMLDDELCPVYTSPIISVLCFSLFQQYFLFYLSYQLMGKARQHSGATKREERKT